MHRSDCHVLKLGALGGRPSFRRGLAIALLASVWGCSANETSPSATAAGSNLGETFAARLAPSPSPDAAAAPTAKPQRSPQAIALNNQGVSKLARADYSAALQDFNQAVELAPQLAEAYLGRGIAYSGMGQRQAAIQNYTKAAKLRQNFAEAFLNRADEYMALGNKEAAIADLQMAQSLFKKRGDQATAKQTAQRLARLQPPTPTPPTVATPAPQPSPSPSVAAVTPVASPAPPQSPEMALAQHLRRIGARMYGTYWCSSCQWQKDQFKEARSQLEYVECDPRGKNPQPDRCRAANVQAYPTWEINGRLYPPGGLSLQELAELSNYQGPHNFQS